MDKPQQWLRIFILLSVLAFICGFTLLSTGKAIAQTIVGSTTSATGSGSTTLSFSHTPGAGGNKLLLVAVGVGSTVATFPVGDDPTPPAITSVTYNGVPMSLVKATIGYETRSNLYSLLNPPAGPANVVITAASSQIANGTPARINGSATTFINVNQTTPLGTPVSVESSANSGTLDLIVSPTSINDVVFSTMTVDEGGSIPTIAIANGQTALSNQNGSATYTATHSASSYKPGTGSSVTSTYTFTSQDHSGIAVLVRGIACTSPNCGTVTLVKNP
ncbi:MAG: hypothetical protein R2822_01355 [Spirosomataceae bacterium]